MKNRNLHTALAAFFFAAFHVYGANTGNATIKLTPGGELATRVNRNFDRLEDHTGTVPAAHSCGT